LILLGISVRSELVEPQIDLFAKASDDKIGNLFFWGLSQAQKKIPTSLSWENSQFHKSAG
jgi:hypothetical protein